MRVNFPFQQHTTMTAPMTYSRAGLRTVLTTWHASNIAQRPALFPGPLAATDHLATWLEDVRQRCVIQLNLHQQHWPNAVISWVPEAPNGTRGFREQILDAFNEKRTRQELINGRFWEWNDFKQSFEKLCILAKWKRYGTIGAVAVGSGVLIPALGVAGLAAAGFTAGGVAAGSLAAAIQSAIYGGATGGVFSILQSIGAVGAFPVAANFVAALGAGAGAAAASGAGGSVGGGNIQVGDIGDP